MNHDEQPSPLKTYLDHHTSPGTFFKAHEDGTLRCFACAHRCTLHPQQRGICQVRFNKEGVLMVPWGYTAGLALDPIEKKPFNHFLPGAMTLSFGMLGCNLHCQFCQNWVSAQALADPEVEFSPYNLKEITPADIVENAVRNHASVVASTYNEPLITSEWAFEIFQLAHNQGLKTAFVSNGFATPEGIKKLSPVLNALKIDLKCASDDGYHDLGGRFQDVINTIELALSLGIWVEVVTLLVPTFNDHPKEIFNLARSLVDISPMIPWHVTAFHPAYHLQDVPATSAQALQTAAEIGQDAGLLYVYAGNLPDKVGSLVDTHCHQCHRAIVRRRGFQVTAYHVSSDGRCNFCQTLLPGVWNLDGRFSKTKWVISRPK